MQRVAWSPPCVDLQCLQFDRAARLHLSEMPVLLIDLAFEDVERWSRLIACETRGRTQVRSAVPFESTQPLVRQVLIVLWHLAQLGDRVGVRLIDPTLRAASQLAELDVSALECLYLPATALLAARWPHQQRYWQELVDAARACDHTRLERSFLIGLQMLEAPTHGRFIA